MVCARVRRVGGPIRPAGSVCRAAATPCFAAGQCAAPRAVNWTAGKDGEARSWGVRKHAHAGVTLAWSGAISLSWPQKPLAERGLPRQLSYAPLPPCAHMCAHTFIRPPACLASAWPRHLPLCPPNPRCLSIPHPIPPRPPPRRIGAQIGAQSSTAIQVLLLVIQVAPWKSFFFHTALSMQFETVNCKHLE